MEEAGGEDEIEIDIGEEQDSACYNSGIFLCLCHVVKSTYCNAI